MRKIRAAIAAPILFRDMLSICKYSPRFVIEFSKSHVSLIPLCNIVVKYHIMLATIIEHQLSSRYHRYTSRYSIPWLEQTIADHLLNSELPPQHR